MTSSGTETTVIDREEDCPSFAKHNVGSSWGISDAVIRRWRNYEQTQCPDCGLWAIWKRRPRALSQRRIAEELGEPIERVREALNG